MKIWLFLAAFGFVLGVTVEGAAQEGAVPGTATEGVYLDELMESSLASLQQRFPKLRKEGCFRLADGRFLMISMARDGKPWRVVIAADLPCRRADDGPDLDVRERRGIALGDTTVNLIEKLGRPDASADPEPALRRLGELEHFYICRVSEGCARHKSIFVRNGVVSAIAEWYSE